MVVPILELMGIFIVAEAALVSFGRYVYCLITRNRIHVKGRLAAGLLLGLEFMMTAEILKTIVIRDTKELLILGAVILLRALLSLLIHFEMKEEHDHPLSTYARKSKDEK